MKTSRMGQLACWLLGTSATFAAPTTAQTIWNVPPPDIQSVIQQASPGDVLVLTSGGTFPAYYPFTLNKGLTIVGNVSSVGYWPGSPTPAGIQVSIPAGQVAHLIGIDCRYSYSPYGGTSTPVTVQSGSVRFEDCILQTKGPGAALMVGNADVVVNNSTITAVGWVFGDTGYGITATNGRLTLRDCVVDGANSGCAVPAGCMVGNYGPKAAISLVGASLHAERCTIRGGGNITNAAANGAPALESSNSSVWLADCTLIGGDSPTTVGGTALVNTVGVAIELRNTTLTPGVPGGTTSSGAVNPLAPLLRAELTPTWTRGTTSTLTIRGDANAPYGLFLTPATTAVAVALFSEPVWLPGAVPLTAGLLDPLGVATHTIVVPNLPALQHSPVWCQAASAAVFPLRASTITGGVVR